MVPSRKSMGLSQRKVRKSAANGRILKGLKQMAGGGILSALGAIVKAAAEASKKPSRDIEYRGVVPEHLSKIIKKLIGRTIVGAKTMEPEDLADLGWSSSPICLVLDDGTMLAPFCDEERNGPGVLVYAHQNGSELLPLVHMEVKT